LISLHALLLLCEWAIPECRDPIAVIIFCILKYGQSLYVGQSHIIDIFKEVILPQKDTRGDLVPPRVRNSR